MDIERNDYMDGKADAEGRRPRRVQASAAYEAGFLDGIAERSAYTRPVSFSNETIQGMKISASERKDDGTYDWTVSNSVGSFTVTGSAPDLETSIAAAEGVLRSHGMSVARRYVIAEKIKHLHPTASVGEVERLTDRVVEYMLSKGA